MSLRQICTKLLEDFLAYIMPFRCLMCQEVVMQANSFCPTCWGKLSFITKPFCQICSKILPFSVGNESICIGCYNKPPLYDKARAVLRFDQESKKLIHNFKYYDRTNIAKAMALNMLNMHQDILQEADVLIPVPMHKFKRMLRFYNQAFILAKELSLLANKPILTDVLIKSRWTKSQATLSKKQRQSNLENSFGIKNPQLINGKKVILIDDVLTTGSTATICTKQLKKHASKVFVMSIAIV